MDTRRTTNRALDWINFFLADVRGALGPFLGIYLLTVQQWDQGAIGLLMTVSGLVGLAANTPVGAFIDATRFKRGVVVAGVAIVAVGACAIAAMPRFAVVLPAKLLIDLAGAALPPAVAAITLGTIRRSDLARRFGRNAVFDHAGNVFTALVCGAVGWWFSQRAVFYVVPIFAMLSTLAVLRVPADAIDHDRARGADDTSGHQPQVSSLRTLVECKPLLVFAACAALFHFANAPMLPLVGQKLALANHGQETVLMSACVVVAQVVMLVVANMAGRKADSWGRRPILLAAFAVLPVRGVLYTLSDDKFWLLGVELLDGIGAGVFSVLVPLLLADLMRGTGRYNVAAGALATVQGIGAALSSVVAGVIVVKAGYSAAFLVLASVATAALSLLFVAMPETRMTENTEEATSRSPCADPVAQAQ